MIRKILAILMSASLIMTLPACGDEESKTASTESSSSSEQSSEDTAPDSEGGSGRKTRDEETAMGDSGTYTIFVYMCGSDLESQNGMATGDIQEMIESSANENARFVVETGGSTAWQNEFVNPGELDRFVIENGNVELVDKQELANMGDSKTLSDFLTWGVKNYPASKMSLIFWDHGGGSLGGVCVDENFEHDTLSLKEIDAGLYSVFDEMSDKFEFIGFDACLMGTIETAGILATHSRYMIGSEETEPGYGWNYTQIGNAVAQDPSIDGAELGKVICEGFYEMCTEIGQESKSTLSVIDLSKTDDVINAYKAYEDDVWNAMGDEKAYANVIKGIVNSDNYGGNNDSEGYANMVDMAGVVNAGAQYSENAQSVLTAIGDAVVYTQTGNGHSEACGLSTYFPFGISDGSEIDTFSDVCVSLHYLGFVDKLIYGATNGGDYSGYDPDRIVGNEDYINYFGTDDYSYDEETGDYTYIDETDETWANIEGTDQTGESSLITFSTQPNVDEDGSYNFTLDSDGIENSTGVQAMILGASEDGNSLISYGISNILNGDWETGEFSDNFDGSWFSLPDGQILTVYLTDETETSTIYSSPVIINGKRTNLQIEHMDEGGEVRIVGIWDGIDSETGASARTTDKLKKGDVIIPVHETFSVSDNSQSEINGEEYTFDGEPEIYAGQLPDGDYYYAFTIDDIYGDYLMTDPQKYTINGESISFSKE